MKYLPILFCAALTVFFTYFPITDTDIFWHLAAGREMVAQKHFLFTDPFSFTLASPQWIDLHWLFQLIVYGLYLLGGLKAIIIFKLAVVACVSIILCLIFRSARSIFVSAFLVAILFYNARYLVLDRPVLITMFCMALYLFLFERVRQGKNKKWLWLCVPLQILWTNSQGLYPIGLFIIGAYWIENFISSIKMKKMPSGEKQPQTGVRSMTVVFIAVCCACLANPYGPTGLTLPFTLFGRITPDAQNIYSLNISENVPLFSLTGFEAGYRTAVLATAFAVLTLFILYRKKCRIAHVLLFAGFLFLACSAVRNVLLYFMVLVPIIAASTMHLDVTFKFSGLSVFTKRILSFAAVCAGLAMLAVPFVEHYSVVAAYPPDRDLSPFRFPEKITTYLKANPVQGEMFNDIRYGGYLIWNLYPGKKVFIDGRLVIRPPRFFADYLAIEENPGLFPSVSDKFNITQVILPSAIFDRSLKLIKWLYESNQWHLEYTDGTSLLFVRNDASQKPAVVLSDPAVVKAIADGINTEWRESPYVRREALGYFSDLLRYLEVRGWEKSRAL
jgi:hypothetical protein